LRDKRKKSISFTNFDLLSTHTRSLFTKFTGKNTRAKLGVAYGEGEFVGEEGGGIKGKEMWKVALIPRKHTYINLKEKSFILNIFFIFPSVDTRQGKV